MRIILEGGGAFPELEAAAAAGKLRDGIIEAVAVLPNGTSGGRPSVSFVVKDDRGDTVFVQMTLRMMQVMNAAFMAKYGDVTDNAMAVIGGKDAVMGWVDPDKPGNGKGT